MRNILNILFSIIFQFTATAIVLASDNIRIDAGIVFLQFMFIAYQILMLTGKDKSNKN